MNNHEVQMVDVRTLKNGKEASEDTEESLADNVSTRSPHNGLQMNGFILPGHHLVELDRTFSD